MIAILNILLPAMALAVAWRFLRRDENPAWRIMVPYLALVCITEITGAYLGMVLGRTNVLVYNVFILIEGFFISSIAYLHCRQLGMKPVVLRLWWVGFLVVYLAEWASKDGLTAYLTHSIVMLSCSFIGVIAYYGWRLMLYPQRDIQLHRHAPSLWMVAIGYFYFGTLLASVLAEALITYRLHIYGIPVYSLIYLLLNFILYGLWIYSFTCRYRRFG